MSFGEKLEGKQGGGGRRKCVGGEPFLCTMCRGAGGGTRLT